MGEEKRTEDYNVEAMDLSVDCTLKLPTSRNLMRKLVGFFPRNSDHLYPTCYEDLPCDHVRIE